MAVYFTRWQHRAPLAGWAPDLPSPQIVNDVVLYDV
jgi:hypothetical protein